MQRWSSKSRLNFPKLILMLDTFIKLILRIINTKRIQKIVIAEGSRKEIYFLHSFERKSENGPLVEWEKGKEKRYSGGRVEGEDRWHSRWITNP